MIALSSVFGKIFHQIIVNRLERYLTKNEFVDTTIQKGFMKGVSGCVDHNHYEPRSQKCLNLLSTRELSNKSQNCLYKVSNQFLIWSQTCLKI